MPLQRTNDAAVLESQKVEIQSMLLGRLETAALSNNSPEVIALARAFALIEGTLTSIH